MHAKSGTVSAWSLHGVFYVFYAFYNLALCLFLWGTHCQCCPVIGASSRLASVPQGDPKLSPSLLQYTAYSNRTDITRSVRLDESSSQAFHRRSSMRHCFRQNGLDGAPCDPTIPTPCFVEHHTALNHPDLVSSICEISFTADRFNVACIFKGGSHKLVATSCSNGPMRTFST